MIKLTAIILSLYFSILNAEEFKYKVVGKLKTDNVIDFPEGGKFVSFDHEGSFESDIGKYGEYQCRESILYDKNEKLVNMFFACENFDQNGEKFINMGKRFKRSDIDRVVGNMSIIKAKVFGKII